MSQDRKTVLIPSERYTGDTMIKLGSGVSDDAVDFVSCFRALAQKNDAGLQLRKKEWLHIDSNGNGIVSLAEADKWIKDILSAKCVDEEGDRIWSRYRKSYGHAFNRAKAISQEMSVVGASSKTTTDDYIDKKEFRIFIGYLCIYVVMFDAFQLIDGGSKGISEDDDFRIELAEWLTSCSKVSDHSLIGLRDVSDPKSVFSEMDSDGEGMVLLGEWCKYLASKEVKKKTVLGNLLELPTKERARKSAKSTPMKAKRRSRSTSLKPVSRYTGEKKMVLGSGVSDDAVDFVNCFRAMVHKNDRGLQLRKKEWFHIDGNGNGIVSLAEADKWIKDTLHSKCVDEEGDRIWSRYRKSYGHAFNRAKAISQEMSVVGASSKTTTDDYIDKKEFRIFIGYLCIYVVMFDAFQLIDGGSKGISEDDDFRIELAEWLNEYEKVKDHSLVGLRDVSDPKSVFSEMDADGEGMVLLGEWCKYLASKEVEKKTVLGNLLELSTDIASATGGKRSSVSPQ